MCEKIDVWVLGEGELRKQLYEQYSWMTQEEFNSLMMSNEILLTQLLTYVLVAAIFVNGFLALNEQFEKSKSKDDRY